MTVTLAGWVHEHVSEREGAHQTPCGFDPDKWEDCLWCGFVEFWRAAGHPGIPATLTEAEALRCDSGEPPSDGSNFDNVRVGVRERYELATPVPIVGPDAIWTAMKPGTVAVVGGSMGVFPDGSRWRRWDPTFEGFHAVCAFRPDATDRVWWCDPLAPERYRAGTTTRDWNGEWMPKADFLRFIGGLSLFGAMVLPIVPTKEEDDMLPTAYKVQRWIAQPDHGVLRPEPNRAAAPTVTLPAGTEVYSYAEFMDDAGNSWRGVDWPIGSSKTMYLLRFGPGVPADHDFLDGELVPIPPPETDCSDAVAEAVDTEYRRVTTGTTATAAVKFPPAP